MHTKLFTFVFAAILLSLMITACSQDDKSNADEQPPSTTETTTTVPVQNDLQPFTGREAELDSMLDACLETAASTRDMVECNETVAALWDGELNRTYKYLMDGLSKENQEALRASQRKWIEFRDSELAFQSKLYGSMQGSMYQEFAAYARMDVVRKRTLRLYRYAQLISEHGFALEKQ